MPETGVSANSTSRHPVARRKFRLIISIATRESGQEPEQTGVPGAVRCIGCPSRAMPPEKLRGAQWIGTELAHRKQCAPRFDIALTPAGVAGTSLQVRHGEGVPVSGCCRSRSCLRVRSAGGHPGLPRTTISLACGSRCFAATNRCASCMNSGQSGREPSADSHFPTIGACRLCRRPCASIGCCRAWPSGSCASSRPADLNAGGEKPNPRIRLHRSRCSRPNCRRRRPFIVDSNKIGI